MMSSAGIQSSGDGESQAMLQMSASGQGEAAAPPVAPESVPEDGPVDVPQTPPIAINAPTPEKGKDSSDRDGSPIRDDACPICLGEISNICKADSCFHEFCLICLKEWSKQKPVCPLCKQYFTKIMYDIKGDNDYKEWKVPEQQPSNNVSVNLDHFREFLNGENRRFFGYHTTNFPGALALHRHYPRRMQLNQNTIPDAIPSGPRERRPSRYNLRGSSMFRLSVYLNNVWVQPLSDITGRYRQTGPELYREQPALTHRLAPWVNRELQALLPEPQIGIVLRELMQLIEQYPINSREFRRAMVPHLGSRTNHFVHEFYVFARSPYDMVGHDNAAQYIPRYGNVNESSSSSSDDSDAIVEVDSQGNPLSNANLPPPAAATTGTVPVVRQETLTQEGSVVISSGSSSTSSSSEDESTRLRNSGLSADTHNPEPPQSTFMKRLIRRARTFLDTVNSGASTSSTSSSSAQAGSSSGASSSGSSSRAAVQADGVFTQANGQSDQVENSDDGCMIIDEVNRIELIPELVNLSSDGNADSQDDEATSKRLQKRGKSKPSLRRNNPVRIPQEQEPDHTYCSAELSSTGDGTTSNTANSRNIKSRNRLQGRITYERKGSSMNDSDYVPDDSPDDSISLSSSDTASSSHNEWGPSRPSSERNYKKRFKRKRNIHESNNTRLSKKRPDSESDSESGDNNDSDSDWGSVPDRVSYSRYLQRLNKNRKLKKTNQEKSNTENTRNVSSHLVLEDIRVPPIPSSSLDINSDSEEHSSSSEEENSTRDSTSKRTHKQSIKNKTDNPSKVKNSFSIQFNTSPTVKQEVGVPSGLDKEQILRKRILARQKALRASIDEGPSKTASFPESPSEKHPKAQPSSESSKYSSSSRRKDHSSKIKKSANTIETDSKKPIISHKRDNLKSSEVSESSLKSLVESQTSRKRSRKSSKEKKKKKRKKDEKEKYKEREKSKRKEKKKKRSKSKKIRRIESSSEEQNKVSE